MKSADDKNSQWNGRQRSVDTGRRGFLRGAAAAGLAASVGPGAISAAYQPKQGGQFRIAVTGGVEYNLDPLTVNDTMGTLLSFGMLRNCLVELGSDGRARPELADSWEPSSNGRQWLFRLRKDVEFHDGRTFNSDDVVFSMGRLRDPENGNRNYSEIIQDVRPDGQFTVVFDLAEPYADLPKLLAEVPASIVPADAFDTVQYNGTGPFVLERYEPGVNAKLVRNERYFRTSLPHFDEVEVVSINDDFARFNALLNGSVHCIENAPIGQLRSGYSSKLQIIQAVASSYLTFAMRTDVPPFDNNEVRLALKHAIDRDSLQRSLFGGYGVVANDNPVSPSDQFYARLPQRSYDPDRARFHLKRAGASSLSVDLNVSNFYPGVVDASMLYSAQAQKAGIRLNIQQQPADGYWSSVWRREPFVASYWNTRTTPDRIFSAVYQSSSPWNETFWRNSRFDQLLLQARGELDVSRRTEIYRVLQEMVSNEGGSVIPLFGSYLMASDYSIGFNDISSFGNLDGFKCAERWWFR